MIVSNSTVKLRTIAGTGEKIATGINPGVTVGEIVDDITVSESLEPGKVTVTTSAGATAVSSERMKTGMTLNVDGTPYMVVIYGDCNGDGVINSRDVQTILDYLTAKSNLLADNRANFLSADFLNNGVDLESALYLQRYYYGLETIEQ